MPSSKYLVTIILDKYRYNPTYCPLMVNKYFDLVQMLESYLGYKLFYMDDFQKISKLKIYTITIIILFLPSTIFTLSKIAGFSVTII